MTINRTTLILIGIIILLILFMRECEHFGKCPSPQTIIKNTTTIKKVYDTVAVTIFKPIHDVEIKTIIDTIPVGADTTAILKDYFTHHIIQRQFKDTSLNATITDTTFKNQLGKGSLTYKILRPNTIITNRVVVDTCINNNKFKVFIGGRIGGNVTELSEISPYLTFLTKRNHEYEISNNLLLKQPNVSIGTAWLIHL